MAEDPAWQGLQAVLQRAQLAIQRAKGLSERFGASGEEQPTSQEVPSPVFPGPEEPQPSIRSSVATIGLYVASDLQQAPGPGGDESSASPSGSSSMHPSSSPQETSPRAMLRMLPPIKSAFQRMTEAEASTTATQQLGDTMAPLPSGQQQPWHGPQATAEPPSRPASPSGGAAPPHHMSNDQLAPSTSINPLLLVARRLAELQQQQSNTLTQLLGLRLEQLRLRQQQLQALQELLRAESAIVEGTPLQMSAVQQALSLLSQSLEDMDVAASAINASSGYSSGADVAVVAATVSCADARAEDISRMARQLLGVLREYPRRAPVMVAGSPRTRTVVRGATDWELLSLPTTVCGSPDHALWDEPCAICLSSFACDELKAMPCAHLFHGACLDPWLRIKACCPLCKLPLPDATVQVVLDQGPGLAAGGRAVQAYDLGLVGPMAAEAVQGHDGVEGAADEAVQGHEGVEGPADETGPSEAPDVGAGGLSAAAGQARVELHGPVAGAVQGQVGQGASSADAAQASVRSEGLPGEAVQAFAVLDGALAGAGGGRAADAGAAGGLVSGGLESTGAAQGSTQ